jgi:RNA polymerase sigma-70 factor, ECF subfamily
VKPSAQPTPAGSSDAELIQGAAGRLAPAFRTIMERHNRRLYRIARSILGNDSEAEDAVQEAYVKAFTHLESFRGESSLSTWLSRITINEALGRLRRDRLLTGLEAIVDSRKAQIIPFPQVAASSDPERTMAQKELLLFVERALGNLPKNFRIVFVMRVLEGMSVEETADLLGIKQKTVKTRLHRARRLLRQELSDQIGPVLLDAFPFAGSRCARITSSVLQRLGLPG